MLSIHYDRMYSNIPKTQPFDHWMLLPQRKWIWKCLNSILRIQSHGRHNDAVIKTTQTSQEFPIKLIIET